MHIVSSHLCDAAHRVTASDVRALALLHRSHEAHLFVSDARMVPPASVSIEMLPSCCGVVSWRHQSRGYARLQDMLSLTTGLLVRAKKQVHISAYIHHTYGTTPGKQACKSLAGDQDI
jgi:hypothetical protein